MCRLTQASQQSRTNLLAPSLWRLRRRGAGAGGLDRRCIDADGSVVVADPRRTEREAEEGEANLRDELVDLRGVDVTALQRGGPPRRLHGGGGPSRRLDAVRRAGAVTSVDVGPAGPPLSIRC